MTVICRITVYAEEDSTEKRLARALLLLAQYGKDGKPETTVANISQETLAELVGTTRSRVNFFMNKFRKLGFIHYNGGMQIHSSLFNVVLHLTQRSRNPRFEPFNKRQMCARFDPHIRQCSFKHKKTFALHR
jgi:hypothetical protein